MTISEPMHDALVRMAATDTDATRRMGNCPNAKPGKFGLGHGTAAALLKRGLVESCVCRFGDGREVRITAAGRAVIAVSGRDAVSTPVVKRGFECLDPERTDHGHGHYGYE